MGFPLHNGNNAVENSGKNINIKRPTITYVFGLIKPSIFTDENVINGVVAINIIVKKISFITNEMGNSRPWKGMMKGL
ncbi:MAG: hypothetical protein HQ522_15090 [Bacteroidetes bacterium]|nr:hypothetical protein [Bacteroidota bacterium]